MKRYNYAGGLAVKALPLQSEMVGLNLTPRWWQPPASVVKCRERISHSTQCEVCSDVNSKGPLYFYCECNVYIWDQTFVSTLKMLYIGEQKRYLYIYIYNIYKIYIIFPACWCVILSSKQ